MDNISYNIIKETKFKFAPPQPHNKTSAQVITTRLIHTFTKEKAGWKEKMVMDSKLFNTQSTYLHLRQKGANNI